MTTASDQPAMQTPADHPTLVLIRGLPGSGKSYLAAALQAALGNRRVAILDPDATDHTSQAYRDFCAALAAEGIAAQFHPYRFLRAKAYKAIGANQIILWNQAFTNLDGFQKTIVNLQTYAAEHGTHLPVLVVEVTASEATARARVAKREGEGGHGVDQEAFARFLRDYRSFSAEGFNTVIVSGEGDVAAAAAAVAKALEALWQQPQPAA